MCVPYWWCTKHAQLIIGTWLIYKKHFLQPILTKKTFHLIKYLLATFIFFLSFQSVLVNYFSLGSDNIGGGLLIHTNRLPSKQADRWRSHQLQESYLCWKIHISGEILRFIHLVIIGVRNYQSYSLVSKINHRCVPMVYSLTTWASYQMRKIAGCACAGNASNVFPATDFKGNRKLAIVALSRHVRDARAVMHGGIAKPGWRGNVPGIPGACETHYFTYEAHAQKRVIIYRKEKLHLQTYKSWNK